MTRLAHTIIRRRRLVREQYNTVRPHAGIGHVTPDDEHEGRGSEEPGEVG